MNLHLTLQGKGGVGKTLVSTLIAQYLLSKDMTPLCIDTDPVNRTFSGFKAMDVKPLDIMEKDQVNIRNFDNLIEMIMESKNECVIDNGAASFIPLTAYLKENDIFQFLSANGFTIYIHVVLTGGQAVEDTAKGLDYIIKNFGDSAHTVVWLNEYFGEVQYKEMPFEDMQVFKRNKSNILGIIPIPEMSNETFGVDIKQMLEDRVTFDEYLASDDYKIIPKQRIKKFRDTIFNNISIVL
ncbi:MAG: conjugal transfer protein TraL [Proteobacteria bacterium]|nr:conjugal transfer protein TraL [Pseudomonadota bacterium]MBU0966911.1 conjugal transfer protein TraL [Pseudomonadota bacterium]